MDEKSFVVPPDPRLGTVVRDRYRIIRLLGEGGMGAVYEGEHLLIRRRVAIKFLHPQYARTPAAMTRFRREALAATSIGNPHVVEVTDMDQAEDGSPFMVLEYLDGSSLSDEVHDFGPMPLARALHLIKQLCSTLGDVHKKGIVHRDLKPENLFLVRHGDDPDFVKVLDFGISKFASSHDGLTVNLTKTGTAVGSVFFMSPEQARAQDDVDARADVYALGGVFYFMLTGRTVFEGESLPHMLMQIVSDPPPPLRLTRPDVPEGVEACVLRMLAKDRDQRFQSAAEVWAALEPYALSGAGDAQAVPVRSAVFARYSGATTPGTPVPAAVTPEPESSSPEHVALPTSTLHRHVRTLGVALPVLIVALGTAIFVVARGKEPALLQRTAVVASEARPAMPPPAPPASAHLTVRVTPAEAALRVDGALVDNPYHVQLSPGAIKRVEASLAGYHTELRELRVDRDQELELELKKTPEAQLAQDEPRAGSSERRHRRKAEPATSSAQPASAAQLEPSVPRSLPEEPAGPAMPASPTPPAPESKTRDIKRIRI